MLQVIKKIALFIYATLLFYGFIFLATLIGGTTI